MRLYGITERGAMISCSTQVCAITAAGVRLEPVEALLEVGDVLGLDHQGRKARGRVVRTGTLEMALVGGVSALGVDFSSLRAAHIARRERRKARRHRCEIGVRVRAAVLVRELCVRCTDISRTGCYLETPSPLPLGTAVQLALATPHGTELNVAGVVCTQHPNLGMGVQFAEVADDLIQLVDYWGHHLGKYASAPAAAEARPQVLLIEASREARAAYSTALDRAGFKVTTAEQSGTALRLARTTSPHAIVLDLLLPQEDCDLLQQLREDPLLCTIPLVILSGAADNRSGPRPDSAACLHARVASPQQLPALVRRVLGRETGPSGK